MTAVVETISREEQSVTLKGPGGKTLDVFVENPENLENVEVGDEVVISLKASLAISVRELK